MKRIIRRLPVFLVIFAVLAALAAPCAAADAPVKLVLEGKALAPDPAPFLKDGRTMVPLRFIAEAMGYAVDWRGGATSYITVTDAERGIEVTATVVGDAITFRRRADGETREIAMDVAPFIESGRTFVPVRFFAEAFGFFVSWNDRTETVTITSFPSLADKRADTVVSLLGGRLKISLPQGAEGNEYAPDADFAVGETTYRLDMGEEAFFVSASETFACSSGDLTKDARLFIDASLGGSLSDYGISMPIGVSGGVEYVTLTPTHANGDIALLTSALARMPDKTLVFVGVFASRRVINLDANCARLAEDIVATLKPGDSLNLNLKERAARFGDFTIVVPAGYAAARYSGNGLTVYALNKLVAVGGNSPQLGITLGASTLTSDSDKIPTEVADTILGQEIKWNVYPDEGGAIGRGAYAEVFVPTDGETGINLAAAPQTDADWIAIRATARSLKAA
jgi:hypothetical protein